MCAPLLLDTLGNYWAAGVAVGGLLTTTLTNFRHTVPTPILAGPTTQWVLSADSVGRIVTTSTSLPATDQNYLVLAPDNSHWLITADDSGILYTTISSAPIAADVVPRPPDITMSQWPITAGVVCVTCGQASVTVSADLSCWCCTCKSFVPADETNIIVILDE